MDFHIWDIVKATIYYEDSNDYKERPVLVLDEMNHICCSLKITSNTSRQGLSEYAIKKWKEAGLNKESNIRLPKYYCIPENTIIKRYGVLQLEDREKFIKQMENFQLVYNTYYSADIIKKLKKRINENLEVNKQSKKKELPKELKEIIRRNRVEEGNEEENKNTLKI